MLSACSVLSLTPAKGLDQQMAYAYGMTTGLRQATAGALTSTAITSEEAEYVLKVTDQSRGLLDTAKSLQITGDLQSAEERTKLAVNILTQLQTYLASKGK
jgi:hypothetical protein